MDLPTCTCVYKKRVGKRLRHKSSLQEFSSMLKVIMFVTMKRENWKRVYKERKFPDNVV